MDRSGKTLLNFPVVVLGSALNLGIVYDDHFGGDGVALGK